MDTDSLAHDTSWYDEMTLKERIRALKQRIKNLPIPLQMFVNVAFVGLLLLDIAVPDILPVLDELILGALVYIGVTASIQSIRDRRLPAPRKAVDVRDQQGSASLAGDELLSAAHAEVEALDHPPFP